MGGDGWGGRVGGWVDMWVDGWARRCARLALCPSGLAAAAGLGLATLCLSSQELLTKKKAAQRCSRPPAPRSPSGPPPIPTTQIQSLAGCLTGCLTRPAARVLARSHTYTHILPPAGAPLDRLFPVVVEDISKEDQCSAFVAQVVGQHGPIDHAVSCFGAWWQGGARACLSARDALAQPCPAAPSLRPPNCPPANPTVFSAPTPCLPPLWQRMQAC